MNLFRCYNAAFKLSCYTTNGLRGTMIKGLLILILWITIGFLFDYSIAKLNYIPNSSMSIEVTFLTLGVYFSLLHCVFIKVKRKGSSYALFIIPSFVVFLLSWQLIAYYYTESTCTISESKSFHSALSFLDTIEYDPQYMHTKPYKLGRCELGFEYESPEHFRLIIVSADGTVRFNE